jgi:hypothetical protein
MEVKTGAAAFTVRFAVLVAAGFIPLLTAHWYCMNLPTSAAPVAIVV